MKRFISLILTFIMLLSVVSCGPAEGNEVNESVAEPNIEESGVITIKYNHRMDYNSGESIIFVPNGSMNSFTVYKNDKPTYSFSIEYDEVDGIEISNLVSQVNISASKEVATKITIQDGAAIGEFYFVASSTHENARGILSQYMAQYDTETITNHQNENIPIQAVGEHWISNPENEDDYLNNLYFALYSGDIITGVESKNYNIKLSDEEHRMYFIAHCDLMDVVGYENIDFYYNNGRVLVANRDGGKVPFTGQSLVEAFYNLQTESVDKYENVHKKYKFSAQTSIIDIVKRYLNESYSFAPSKISGFNCMLDLENIEAYGLLVENIKTGEEHIVSYFKVDGEEYVAEVNGNKKGAYKLSEIENILGCRVSEESLACVRKETTKGFFDRRLRLEECDGITIKSLPDGEIIPGVTYKELAKFYCGDENLAYNDNPKTLEDHARNMEFLILTKQWDFKDFRISDFTKYKWTSESLGGQYIYSNKQSNLDVNLNLHTFVSINSGLLAGFHNGTGAIVPYYDGHAYHVTTGYRPLRILTQPSEYLRQAVETYQLIRNLYNHFREQGIITSTSTERERAKAYTDWFSKSGNVQIITPNYTGGPPRGYDNDQSFYTATPYSALIARNAICAGRSNAIVLLMRMEGITSYGLPCGPKTQRTGHIVPWMLLDGTEYVYEYGDGTSPRLTQVNKVDMNAPDVGDSFQLYCYNLILQKAGLPFDETIIKKTYMDSNGNAI